MARPKKKVSELSAERLRKLSADEIKRRKQLEQSGIDVNEVKTIKSNKIDLTDINSIAEKYETLDDDLKFINKMINASKKNITKFGVDGNEHWGILKDCINIKSKILKDFTTISKEIANTQNNQNVAFVTPTNDEMMAVLQSIKEEM